MLPAKQRISRKLFDTLFSGSRPLHAPHVSLRVAAIPDKASGPQSRFAFVASKKAVKGAVARNRLRRRGYAVIGRQVTLPQGKLLAFFFKKGAGELSFDEIEQEIIGLLKKIK